jgi:outer membrane protein assembly factor BamE
MGLKLSMILTKSRRYEHPHPTLSTENHQKRGEIHKVGLNMRKIITLLSITLICALLSSCAFFHIYRPTVQQGNLICDQSVAQLHPGMTTDQVLYLMGTPILSPVFQPDRWDYVYTIKHGNAPRYQRYVTLYFCNGVLQNIQVSQWMIVK